MRESDSSTITGKITHVLELQSGDSKKKPGTKWYRQEYVLETFAEWPRQVCFQLWGEDRIKQANIQLGDIVTVQYELSSREYNGKWYTSVDGRFVTKGMPQEGAPMGGYGQATPQYGAAPQYGVPNYGTPNYGTPNYGTPNYGGQPNFGPQQQPNNMPGTDNNFGAGQESDDLPF